MPKGTTKNRSLTISVVGAGRLGQALAIALQSSGHSILSLVARRRQKAVKAAGLLGKKTPPLALGADQLVKLPPTDLIIIATPDDAIAETARHLARFSQGQGKRTVLHTSGALSSEVLAPLAEAKFQTGSLHPLVSISEPVSGAGALRGAFYCLEGTRLARGLGERVVRDLGGTSFSVKAKSKALYHAAAVMASPHLVALFDLASEMLTACGLSRSDASKVLVPLLESTVNNLKTSNPQKALTGTFGRGDIATVRKHLRALSEGDLAQALEVYKLLGRRSIQLAEKNGLDAQLVTQMRSVLESVTRGQK